MKGSVSSHLNTPLLRSVVNLALKGQMKLTLESYKTFFLDRRAPDGSDNGGDWPNDERVYNFKVEGGDAEDEGVSKIMSVKDLLSAAGPSGPTDASLGIKGIETLRRVLGCFFLLFGAAALVYVNTTASRQGEICEEEFGACVWERIEPKLCVRERASDCARGNRLRESGAAARERSGCAILVAKRLRKSED
jgi:hypothetical protein